MKKLYSVLTAFIIYCLTFNSSEASAQTAKVYRGGTLFGTYTTVAAASVAANTPGDSIVLSAHIFKENKIDMWGGQIWQGTMTATDSSIIDAESKGRIIEYNGKLSRDLVIRDIILTRGKDSTFAAIHGSGLVGKTIFRGNSIVRNCFADYYFAVGAGNGVLHLYNKVKIHNNTAGLYGGVTFRIDAYDSAEICYNVAQFGAVAANDTNIYTTGGGGVLAYSQGVRIHHNKASKAGGVVIGAFQIRGAQVYANEAPLAPFGVVRSGLCVIEDAYFYNPGTGPTRQPEILIDSNRELQLLGAWFGDSDTVGVIAKKHPSAKITTGKYAITNWSLNRGKALTKKDTLFPVEAVFTYMNGTPIPAGSYSWLQGNFTSSKGSFVTPKPKIKKDTVGSLFRTYSASLPTDTGSKPVDFVCNVDLDTFRATALVWGKTGINESKLNAQVMIYPNPAKDVINIAGAESGSMITLYSSQGAVVRNQEIGVSNQGTAMDISKLAAGNYILKIKNKDGGEGSAKIIVE